MTTHALRERFGVAATSTIEDKPKSKPNWDWADRNISKETHMIRSPLFRGALLVALIGFGGAALTVGQSTNSVGQKNEGASEQKASYPNAFNALDSERGKLWNSPRMLRARAWLQEYCERSAQITPQEAKQYMAELKNLTPVQMKLWLLKFDEEQEAIDRQQAQFEKARQGSVGRALAVQSATERAYRRIDEGVSYGAQITQQSLRAKEELAQAMYAQRAEESAASARAMMFDGTYSPNFTGFHFHLHPY
jgi:hypothetical protein